MNQFKTTDIDTQFADCVIEKVHSFSVAGRQFYLYPITLGKLYTLQRIVQQLDINPQALAINAPAEAMRIARAHPYECSLVVAYLTCKSKAAVMSTPQVRDTAQLFLEQLDQEDLATMLLYYLNYDKAALFVKHYGFDRDAERRRQVMHVKRDDDKNTFTFGGLTVYGTLIDWAAERYGWSLDYIVWGISVTSLRMLQLDAISTIFVSDDERKRIHVSQDNNITSGDDPQQLKQFINSNNWD